MSPITKKLAALGLVTAASFVTIHEGVRYKAYRDLAGIPTICHGITGPTIRMGQTASAGQCEQYLAERLIVANNAVNDCTGNVPLTEKQRAAFVSFTYNVGNGAFCRSTMARRLRAGDYLGACAELMRWVYVAGKDCRLPGSGCAGIVKRREAEREICLQGTLGAT